MRFVLDGVKFYCLEPLEVGQALPWTPPTKSQVLVDMWLDKVGWRQAEESAALDMQGYSESATRTFHFSHV